MKLSKSEICALAITAAFLLLILGFSLGRDKSPADFSVSGGLTAMEKTQTESDGNENTGEPAAEPININTATEEELQALEGIGPALAQRIVEYRKAEGPFLKIEDITKVQGIGAAKYEAIRNDITVG